MNISVTGFRGIGKTTVSRLLAEKLDKKLISTDEEIAKKTKLSPEKFVRKYGQEKFLDVETDVIEGICDFDECVFDTSSSIVARNENIINLKKNGLIVLITADSKTINSRQKTKQAKKNIEDVKSTLQVLESKYKKAADYTIDTSNLSPEEVCDLIIHYIAMELK